MSATHDPVALAVTALADAIRAEVRAEVAAAASAPDRLLSVDQASDALGIGRTRLYAEVASGHLRSLKVGRRRLIPSSALAEYVASIRAEAGQA